MNPSLLQGPRSRVKGDSVYFPTPWAGLRSRVACAATSCFKGVGDGRPSDHPVKRRVRSSGRDG